MSCKTSPMAVKWDFTGRKSHFLAKARRKTLNKLRAVIRKAPERIIMALTFGSGHKHLRSGTLRIHCPRFGKMPPRKQKNNTKKLADLIKEFRISPLCVAQNVAAEPETHSPGTLSDIKYETKDSNSPKTYSKVPPIFLHKPVDFKDHVEKLLKSGVKFYQPNKGKAYTKVKCLSFEDHKNFVHFLKSNKLPYHTYGNPDHRKNKVVIRGLPKNTCLNALKDELESLKISVVRMHKMHTKETAKQHPLLVLVVVPSDDNKKLMEIETLLGTKVRTEAPIVKTKQCHRCQKWGHSQRYCHGQVRCVKCAGEHWTSKCTRDPNEPPQCANCGGAHTANFKKCPHCPESAVYKLLQQQKPKKQNDKPKLVTLLNYQDKLYNNEITPGLVEDLSDTEFNNYQELD